VRVVIVEDQALLREGLARLVRDGGHEVVGTRADAVDCRIWSSICAPTSSFSISGCRRRSPTRVPGRPAS
jgi:hypothetical protein